MNHTGNRSHRGFLVYLLMLSFLTFIPAAKILGIGKFSLVSTTQNGTQDTSQGGALGYGFLSISPNGRFVAFATKSTFFSGDVNNPLRTHVFVKDRLTGELVVASTTNGTNAFADNDSSEPTISDPIPPSGQSISYCDANPNQCKIRVAFQSTASNLGATNSKQHIFIKEFDLNLDPLRTVLVSANGSGTQSTINSIHPRISGDGQYVFFVNATSDLTTAYTYGNIWRKQILASGTTGMATLVTSVQCLDSNQNPYLCTNGYSNYPAPSYNGRYVVYPSGATNLVSGGTNGKVHIFFQDISLGTREIVSVSSSSAQGDKDSSGLIGQAYNYIADVSDNGERVAFMSKSTNLIPGGTSTTTDKYNIFLRDRATGTTSLVSPEITSTMQVDSSYPNISGNGRFITYCWSPVGGENNQTFLYDIAYGSTQKIKKAANSTYTRNGFPHISGDGRFIVLNSEDALTASDQASKPDVFVYDVIPYPSKQHAGDFNADGATDLGIFRPATSPNPSYWYAALSPTYGSTPQIQLGQTGDVTTPGDYDGDGITDAAIFRNGSWTILNSSNSTTTTASFGTTSDIPVAVDFDADNKTDIAVWRPSDGTWYITGSSVGYYASQFGTSGDKPAPGDYDNDGKADLAVFRPSNGYWYITKSKTSTTVSVQFGASTDIPVQADYDGDGKTDIAVWRSYDSATATDGIWYYLESETSSFVALDFGAQTDKPVPGDYDNDGKTDKAVFRPSTSEWFISRSSTNDASYYAPVFGNSTDIPLSYGNLLP